MIVTRIKICGITNIDDAVFAAEAGADALGFIFVKSSPRYIAPSAASKIIRLLPPYVSAVGVFADAPWEEAVLAAEAAGVQVLQLHGEETPDYCRRFKYKVVKAFRMQGPQVLEQLYQYDVDAFLLDTFVEGKTGGTGRSFPWEWAGEANAYGRIIIAGGLTPDNVGEVVARLHPYGVDVASGVEKEPGIKDHKLVVRFIQSVREKDLASKK